MTALGSGTTALLLSAPLAGLAPGVPYHFRVAARNDYGPAYGSDQSFTSTSLPTDFTYTITNGTITITGYTGLGGAVTIPSTINGLPVTSIGWLAFYWCISLTSITIPDNVTSIGAEAFESSSSLTSVTIPGSVTNIGDAAFLWCTGLTNVTIGNRVTSIGITAFSHCTSLTSIILPGTVAYIGLEAFSLCPSLTAITVGAPNPFYSSLDGVLFNKSQTTLIECPGAKAGSYAIPNSVTSIAERAFANCTGLTNVSIPSSVLSIWDLAFAGCYGLTRITMSSSLTSIGVGAFHECPSLTSVYFEGNAPRVGSDLFSSDYKTTVYYLPGTTGWGATFSGRPTALWIQPPTIQMSPLTQTAEAGSAVGLRVQASSPLPLFYLWYRNVTNLVRCSTNSDLERTNVNFSQAGAYTVVISNVLGAVASAPVMLNVIAPVERRLVPGVRLMGEAGSLLSLDYADSLSPAPNWTPLSSISLTGTWGYCFDLNLPLPPQRFYRAWQTGTPGVRPSLDLYLVPAITLTSSIGHSVRLDYINQFGPIDTWVTLATMTLTNTSQLYFDTSAPGQPPRLYRLVQAP